MNGPNLNRTKRTFLTSTGVEILERVYEVLLLGDLRHDEFEWESRQTVADLIHKMNNGWEDK